MLRTVAAEVTQRGKVHQIGYLSERQTFIVQKVFQNRCRVAVDIGSDAVASYAADGLRQVLGRYVESFGIVAHLTFRLTNASSEQGHQLFYNIARTVGMLLCSIALSMSLKDVVHHRQAQTAHQLPMEVQMAVAHAVTQAMEVGEDVDSLFVGERDNGIMVQRDAAPDAVVVRRQQALQELIVGSKPLHLQVSMGAQVLHPVWHGDYHEVVLHDVVAPLVEHEAPLPRRAQQMHAGVAQFMGVHDVKVGGIVKFNLHTIGF